MATSTKSRLFSQAFTNIEKNRKNKDASQTQENKLYSDAEWSTIPIQRQPNFGTVATQSVGQRENKLGKVRGFDSDSDMDQEQQQQQQEDKPAIKKHIRVKPDTEPVGMIRKPIKKLEITRRSISGMSQQKSDQPEEQQQPKILQPVKNIVKETQFSVFIRNISTRLTKQRLLEFMKEVRDQILDVRMERFIAEVIFKSVEAARQGIEIVDQQTLCGQVMKAVLQQEANKNLAHNKIQVQPKSSLSMGGSNSINFRVQRKNGFVNDFLNSNGGSRSRAQKDVESDNDSPKMRSEMNNARNRKFRRQD